MRTMTAKFIYWTPRIASMLLIGFLALFSFDVITPEASAGEIAVGLFMHNIPVFVLAAVLAVSWKREIIAGIVFVAVGLLFLTRTAVVTLMNGFEWIALVEVLMTFGLPTFIGTLFMVNWRKRLAGRGRAAA